ncbi:5-formyltetrahydrofolate cyclo-ligase [Sphingoaurantiacus capsulatus]|uniref:5-formyltetrahydrofolate cyclo-ligase n=1 Tax=Sphingoaurantiacus capsulatus TaxID=1771310 RepID=A0ABV7XFR9_9SPHN
MDKPAFRREMRRRRAAFVAALPASEREALLAALAERLLALIPDTGIVAGYSAYGDEIDVSALGTALGDRYALPWFAAREDPMTFRRAGTAREDGPFRIAQPTADAEIVEPDVLLVPLVAADLAGNRVGQGKGHYDRALAGLAARKPILTLGIAWDVQVVEALPPDPWDVPLDRVVTPSRILG